MPTRIEVAQQGGVVRVVFRGDKGIQLLSADVRAELETILSTLADDTAARVVVFAAEGRTFLAGTDIQELAVLSSQTGTEYALAGQRLMQRIADLPAITVAAIHAACAGGGCELALACDLRLAAEGAKIGLPETSLGVIPGWGGTVRALRLLGPSVARRLILTGELLSGPDACRLGLVHDVFPDNRFAEAVEARVQQLLTRGPQAQQRVKRLLDDWSADWLPESAFLDEAQAFGLCCGTDEAAEGIASFLEKRPARWKR